MKVMLVFVLACVAFAGEARAQSSCAETIPKESQLVPAGEERIEGGTRCFVKPKDGGERSLHTVIWDPPIIEDKEPKKKDPKPQPAAPVAGGCDATESLLAEARELLRAREPPVQAAYLKVVGSRP